ncbi:hypothetical protein JCM11491_003277 [Sporobolomyces phaffii]
MDGTYPADVPTLAASPHLQNALVGPCVVGYQLQFILFGILIQQVYEYGCELRSHSRLSKYTAVIVVALNVVYTAVCFEEGYTQAAGSDRTVITLFNGSLAWQTLPLFNGLIAAAAEGFLTLRAGAFFLNRKAKIAFYVWQGALIVLVLFGSVASLAQGVIAFYSPDAPEGIPYNTAVSVWLWACAVADCSISVALAYNLHQRIAHFNAATDSVLRKLILIGLRTASFTAILSVAGALMSSIYSGWDPSKVDIPVAFWVPTGALYGISLFTTLSATRQVVERRLGGGGGTGGTGGGGGGPGHGSLSPGGGGRSPFPHPYGVTTTTTTTTGGTTTTTTKPHSHRPHYLTTTTPRSPAAAGVVRPLAISVTREVVRDVDSEEKSEYSGSINSPDDRAARAWIR